MDIAQQTDESGAIRDYTLDEFNLDYSLAMGGSRVSLRRRG